jgi:hypothetical protein
MSQTITSEQVVSAARDLDRAEFTRADLATALDVQRSELKEGFKAARKAGSLEKIRDDEEGTGLFRLTDQ